MKYTRESVIEYIAQCRKDGIRIDLSSQDLPGLDLREADLQQANLQQANLREADLQQANLRGAYLQQANLQQADLRGADLREADLQQANLQQANLRGADLDFTGFNLSCKTIGIICDKRLMSQLLYHLCRLDVKDCPEWDELRKDERIITLANQSHVIPAHGLPRIET